jgi:hypothetical protein
VGMLNQVLLCICYRVLMLKQYRIPESSAIEFDSNKV